MHCFHIYLTELLPAEPLSLQRLPGDVAHYIIESENVTLRPACTQCGKAVITTIHSQQLFFHEKRDCRMIGSFGCCAVDRHVC